MKIKFKSLLEYLDEEIYENDIRVDTNSGVSFPIRYDTSLDEYEVALYKPFLMASNTMNILSSFFGLFDMYDIGEYVVYRTDNFDCVKLVINKLGGLKDKDVVEYYMGI